MKLEHAEVSNFKNAFRGMRNPLNSWDLSDSYFGLINVQYDGYEMDKVIEAWVRQELEKSTSDLDPELLDVKYFNWLFDQGVLSQKDDAQEVALIGPNDLALAQKLIASGPEHAKFTRQIIVSVDITAPLYWWKEFDTYKVGTVANSTSTMHKLTSAPITKSCFEMDDVNSTLVVYDNLNKDNYIIYDAWENILDICETLRVKFNETKDIRYWKELIRLLPESWLQTRTVTLNYAVLRNIYSQRKNHKLTEWHTFCDWLKDLPYGYELITLGLD